MAHGVSLFRYFAVYCDELYFLSLNNLSARSCLGLIACRLKVICIGSRPSDHYFRSVCLSVCLFVCAEFFSAVFDPISIKLGHMLYVWV